MAQVVVIRDLYNTEVQLRANPEPQDVPDEVVEKYPFVFEGGYVVEESADELTESVDEGSEEE